MKNADETAFPFEGGNNNGIQPSSGLIKREYFAAMAMQGFISAGVNGMPNPGEIALLATGYADALLKELDK